jgi:hypothetical protein
MVDRLRGEATRILDTSGSEAETRDLVETALERAIAGRR